MSWLDDILSLGGGDVAGSSAGPLSELLMGGGESYVSDIPSWYQNLANPAYGFGGDTAEGAADFFSGPADYGSIEDFGGGPEVRGNWDYDYSGTGVGQGPSFWQQANDFYAPIERTVSSPLGKLGIGALGALASAYGANRQNKNYKQAVQEALAAKAAARAQHMTDTAPMRVTNQRAAAPSWGANQRRAFSGNSLAAMTPRSSGTMYAAEGGGVSGHGGLCQACAARQNYVEGGTAGQDDKIPAMLSDGEYIVDADVVSALGDGNNAAGAKKLDKMRVGIRTHKRSASPNKIPPKAKKPEAYLKGAK